MNALLIVDVQNDFLPGGTLAIPKGDEIIPTINALQEQFDLIIASKDWHPPKHVSFASTHGKQPGDTIQMEGYVQELWPDHCVQNTWGAEFVPSLKTNKLSYIVYKGKDPQVDSYSAFFDQSGKETGLEYYLKEKRIDDLYVVGLATDVCVRYSVLDALKLGFNVTVFKEGCRGLKEPQKAFKEMQQAGARIV